MTAITFAAVFAALFAAHSFGDHWWGQTHVQALGKGARSPEGVRHCLGHVVLLTVAKVVAVALMMLVTGLRPNGVALVVGLLVDAVSHYWADRRYTLKALAERTGKAAFYQLGQPRPGSDDAPHLGTGAYAMDQSWHVAWLFIAALIVAGGST